MSQPRQTQIIATLGPESNTYEKILALHQDGANFFRLNFSHGTPENHAAMVRLIHQVRLDHNADIGILADLQGPKIRIGKFENKAIALTPGQKIRFDQDPAPGNETRVQLPHPDVIEAMEVGYRFLLDDGNVRMRIEEKGTDDQGREYFIASVLTGTILSDRKGVNVPDLRRPIPAITKEDKDNLEIALGLGVDWVAASFVQTPEDVAEIKKLIAAHGSYAKVIAKIEKPDALRNIDGIIAEADGIMVARGDLAVEFNYAQVPLTQLDLIDQVRRAGKPIIVATQMLESMVANVAPTRAEATDVSYAALFAANATMLSGETANGKNPVEAVKAMRELIEAAEQKMQGSQRGLTGIFAALASLRASYPPARLDTWQDRRLAGAPVPHDLGRYVHDGLPAPRAPIVA